VRGAETAEPIELPFGLWIPVGRRKQSLIVFARWRQCAHMAGHTGATTTELSVGGGDAVFC